MSDHVQYMTVRDKNRNPCMQIAYLVLADGRVRVGWSCWNPQDRYDIALGRYIAVGRMAKGNVVISPKNPSDNRSIQESILSAVLYNSYVPRGSPQPFPLSHRARMALYFRIKASEIVKAAA